MNKNITHKISSYAETFMVGFSSTNNEVGSFSWSNPITVATNEYQTYHATLPTGTKYIAIQCISYRKYYLLIDDIIVGNEAIGGEWMTKTTAETETQLINLDAGTQYEVQVRSDCNPDGWCNMITFETELDGTKVFVTEGDWNIASNWVPQCTPALNNKVIIRADVTILSGCVAEASTSLPCQRLLPSPLPMRDSLPPIANTTSTAGTEPPPMKNGTTTIPASAWRTAQVTSMPTRATWK